MIKRILNFFNRGKEEYRRDEQELVLLYREVFQTEGGKKILEDLIHASGLFQPNGGRDSMFQDGRRDVVCYILRQVYDTQVIQSILKEEQ